MSSALVNIETIATAAGAQRKMLQRILEATGADGACAAFIPELDGQRVYTGLEEVSLDANVRNLNGRAVLIGGVGTGSSGLSRRRGWTFRKPGRARRNAFSSLSQDFKDLDELRRSEIWEILYEPFEVQDQLRAMMYDGPRFLGVVNVMRCADSADFTAKERDRANRLIPYCSAYFRAAWTSFADACGQEAHHAVFDSVGSVMFASPAISRWLTRSRMRALASMVRRIDGGHERSANQLLGLAKVSFVRLDGIGQVSYLATFSPPSPPVLHPSDQLTNREREVAELAAAGATVKDVSRLLGTSSNTVKAQLKVVYERLGVASRVELAQRLG